MFPSSPLASLFSDDLEAVSPAFGATSVMTDLTAFCEPSVPEAAAAPTAASRSKVAAVMVTTSSRVNPLMCRHRTARWSHRSSLEA